MQTEFTSEQEMRLAEIADHEGQAASELVREAALRLLWERERFLAGVRRGIEAADRGEFVEPEVVWTRMEEILQT